MLAKHNVNLQLDFVLKHFDIYWWEVYGNKAFFLYQSPFVEPVKAPNLDHFSVLCRIEIKLFNPYAQAIIGNNAVWTILL